MLSHKMGGEKLYGFSTIWRKLYGLYGYRKKTQNSTNRSSHFIHCVSVLIRTEELTIEVIGIAQLQFGMLHLWNATTA